jgi:regulatory protein
MNKITGLKAIKGHEKRVRIFFDNGSSIVLLSIVALDEGIREGREISDRELASMVKTNNLHRSYNSAVRLLGYRPRSEAEVRQRLRQRGFDGDSIEKTVLKLKNQGLLDDTAFARFWKENRDAFRPRSRRLTRIELQKKGLENSIIENILSELDEGDAAYRAAVIRARHLPADNYQVFRRKLGAHLARRGFGWDVIKPAVEKAWKERSVAGGLKIT